MSAQSLRDQGAVLFGEGRYTDALKQFESALGLLPTSQPLPDDVAAVKKSCLLNASSCCVKLERFPEAIEFASTVISEFDKKCAKAFYRRGQAHLGMKNLGKARVDLMIASELSSGDATIEAELQRLRSMQNALPKERPSERNEPASTRGSSSGLASYETMLQQLSSLGGGRGGLDGFGAGGGNQAALMQQLQQLQQLTGGVAGGSASAVVAEPATSTSRDLPASLQPLKDRAEGGDIEAMVQLGDAYEKGLQGAPKNPQAALEWWQQAAEKGHATAMSYVAWCHRSGFGTRSDAVKALTWYRKAAEAGIVKAQACLAFMLEKGEGVTGGPSDASTQEAVRWYNQAATGGDSVAQVNFGLMLEKGNKFVEKNLTEALRWFQAAAEQGNLNACINTGLAYEKGQGVEKDMTVAFGWYMRAAKENDATAQAIVGCCYEKGLGTTEDHQEALRWYMMSSKQGNGHAREGLKRLTGGGAAGGRAGGFGGY